MDAQRLIPYDVYRSAIRERETKIDKVMFILDHFKEARNNDNYLCLLYWKLVDLVDHMDQIETATKAEVIRRARQKINERNLYLPTDPDVRKLRRISQDKVRSDVSNQ